MRKSKYLIAGMGAAWILMIGVLPVLALPQGRADISWSKTAKSLAVFQPGDAIRIQVWELYQKENRNLPLSGDYPINPDGMIIMPLLGEIKVKGMTNYELMQILKEKFSNYLNDPFIYVRPLIRVTMQGAFIRPGAYRVDPASSLWDLIQLAGGPDANCDLEKIRVERSGNIAIRNLLNSFEKGYSLEEIGIESGDQIIGGWRGGWNLGTLINMVNFLATVLLLWLRLKGSQY
jgi:protein involved in polysaccharide export with SLBB domain